MQAIQILSTGGPEVLTLQTLADPEPKAGEALIRIEASGVNFIDTYFREGRYPEQLPYTLGQEAAGTIVSVGPGVSGFSAGDRVAWCGIPGTYAELAVAPAARLVKIPDELTTEQAAAAILQGMTAHYLVHDTYALRYAAAAGESVLIHAGAGGTGLLLIQLAKRLGVHVITTVSTEEKAALAREAGADHVILYTQEDLVARVREITAGKLLPVVYDSVGKTTFEQSLQCLRPRGMLVLFGGASGAVPPFDLIRLSTMGSLYITRPTLKDYISTRPELEARATDIFNWVADGSLKLRIAHTYPLRDAARAQVELAGRKTTGKLLLIP
jgi:NADPH2:quinone reductase